MNIIIEGCDGVGKTTLAKKLADKYCCDILHMTKNSDKTLDSYISKMLNKNIIFDRCFISEYVYSKVFNRTTNIDEYALNFLLNFAYNQNYKIFILSISTDEIIKRLNIRGDEENDIIKNVSFLNDEYINCAKKFNIPIISGGENIDSII